MDVTRARALLADERRRVEESLERSRGELRSEHDELIDQDQHQADSASELSDREDAEGRTVRLEEQLEAVARAEHRLEAGTYGVSIESGAPISDARLETMPTVERTADEESAREAGGAPPGDGDDTTPLDAVEPPPPDLADIPMARSADPEVDPQETDDEIQLDIAGEAYDGEGGAAGVGLPDPDDAVVDRDYRPE